MIILFKLTAPYYKKNIDVCFTKLFCNRQTTDRMQISKLRLDHFNFNIVTESKIEDNLRISLKTIKICVTRISPHMSTRATQHSILSNSTNLLIVQNSWYQICQVCRCRQESPGFDRFLQVSQFVMVFCRLPVVSLEKISDSENTLLAVHSMFFDV